MNKLYFLLLTLFLFGLQIVGFSQIKFSVEQMPGSDEWGVYARPCQAISPSSNTITGSAQVTLVLPIGSDIAAFTNHAGLWEENATVIGPNEAPNKVYISFGFLSDSPQIVYNTAEPTLLFSFLVAGSDTVTPALIDNDNDPFANYPNSAQTNPGNEISVIDIGVSPVSYYAYNGNFLFNEMDDCFEVSDTTIVTPPEDDENENPTQTLEQVNVEDCFSLSPNPTSTWITVNFLQPYAGKSGTMKLWTANGIALGELMQNGQNKMTLNVGALPNGLYFLSYESDRKLLQQERFMKQ